MIFDKTFIEQAKKALKTYCKRNLKMTEEEVIYAYKTSLRFMNAGYGIKAISRDRKTKEISIELNEIVL